MTTYQATRPIREEHRQLLPHIEALRVLADSIGEAPVEDVVGGLDEAHEFLAHHLIPHALAEDRALYPVVARLMGAEAATATMSRDHVEVGRLAEALPVLRERVRRGETGVERDLRRILYGLYALVSLHFAEEEEIYLPLLDERLTEAEASELFEAMEAAAGEAHREVPPASGPPTSPGTGTSSVA